MSRLADILLLLAVRCAVFVALVLRIAGVVGLVLVWVHGVLSDRLLCGRCLRVDVAVDRTMLVDIAVDDATVCGAAALAVELALIPIPLRPTGLTIRHVVTAYVLPPLTGVAAYHRGAIVLYKTSSASDTKYDAMLD